MAETNRQIPYLDHRAKTQIGGTARERRLAALKSISRYCIVISKDGMDTQEVLSDHPMSLSDLANIVGEDAFVVAVSSCYRSRTPRTKLLLLAAE